MERRRILLVEDDTPLRLLMRRHLAGRGYRVAEAASVAQAVEVLQHFVPELLVLDIGLPDGSGWEVARQARNRTGAHVPIVVCSSHEPSAADLQERPIQGYVPKPFDLRMLVERVDAALAPGRSAYLPTAGDVREDDRDVAFFSSLAHDMRTPMATLRTAVESLTAGDVEWDDEARREFLAAIASSAERVSKYARDVLDLARLDAGALHPQSQCVLPEETIEALARAFEYQPGLPRVSFRIAPGTPAARGDPACVQRILVALLENAVRFSPPEKEIVVELSTRAGEVQWRVADRGRGVPPGDGQSVFGRHYRARKGRPSSRDPAISLYISAELARLQGGRMWVEPVGGGGACFCLALPAMREAPG